MYTFYIYIYTIDATTRNELFIGAVFYARPNVISIHHISKLSWKINIRKKCIKRCAAKVFFRNENRFR